MQSCAIRSVAQGVEHVGIDAVLDVVDRAVGEDRVNARGVSGAESKLRVPGNRAPTTDVIDRSVVGRIGTHGSLGIALNTDARVEVGGGAADDVFVRPFDGTGVVAALATIGIRLFPGFADHHGVGSAVFHAGERVSNEFPLPAIPNGDDAVMETVLALRLGRNSNPTSPDSQEPRAKSQILTRHPHWNLALGIWFFLSWMQLAPNLLRSSLGCMGEEGKSS